MREPKDARRPAATHGRRNLEAGRVQGKARPERLNQRFLERPQTEEQVNLPLSTRRGQRRAFAPRKHRPADAVKITTSDPLLHIHPDTAGRGQRDQAVRAAVTDIKTDGRRRPIYKGIRLAILSGTESQFIIPTIEPTAQQGTECRAAQGKLTPGTRIRVALPARAFLLVEPGQCGPLAGRIGCQINLKDGSPAGFPERTPPALIPLIR